MTVLVHSIAIICLKFLSVDRLDPTATLMQEQVNRLYSDMTSMNRDCPICSRIQFIPKSFYVLLKRAFTLYIHCCHNKTTAVSFVI